MNNIFTHLFSFNKKNLNLPDPIVCTRVLDKYTFTHKCEFSPHSFLFANRNKKVVNGFKISRILVTNFPYTDNDLKDVSIVQLPKSNDCWACFESQSQETLKKALEISSFLTAEFNDQLDILNDELPSLIDRISIKQNELKAIKDEEFSYTVLSKNGIYRTNIRTLDFALQVAKLNNCPTVVKDYIS